MKIDDDRIAPAGQLQVDLTLIMPLFAMSSVLAACLRGPDHRIDDVNPACTEIASGRVLVGHALAEALPETVGQGLVTALDDVLKTGKLRRIDGIRIDYPAGAERPAGQYHIDCLCQPVVDSSGHVIAILLQGIDVTARAAMSQVADLARSDAEQAETLKSQFVSQLSHDIRSPMSAVLSLVNILANTHPLTAEQREYLRILKLSAESVMTQVAEMVDGARIESRSVHLENAAFSPVDLLHDIAGAISVQAGEKGLEIEVESSLDKLSRYIGDAMRIRQVIIQLASNAIRYTSSGTITLTIRPAPYDGAGIVLEVADTGQGIAQDKLEALFQKPQTSPADHRYGSNGLGLTLSRALTELMGGTIAARSAEGEGTTFTVRLPLQAVASEPVGEADDATGLADGAVPEIDASAIAPILLVEDYEPNILVATTFLKRFGFSVDVAVNGRIAVEKAKSGTYSLALMDVQMPGMNGLEATRLIRENEAEDGRSRLPVIGVTAHALAVDRDRCLEAGMDDYLAKPFNASDLHDKIMPILKAG